MTLADLLLVWHHQRLVRREERLRAETHVLVQHLLEFEDDDVNDELQRHNMVGVVDGKLQAAVLGDPYWRSLMRGGAVQLLDAAEVLVADIGLPISPPVRAALSEALKRLRARVVPPTPPEPEAQA